MAVILNAPERPPVFATKYSDLSMNEPRRPRQSQKRPTAPPPTPLSSVIRDHDRWRSNLSDKPTRGALRDYWKKLDTQYAQRPDYLLWRELHDQGSPPQRRQDLIDVATRAIKAPEPIIHWPALALVLDILQNPTGIAEPKFSTLQQTLRQRLDSPKQPQLPLNHTTTASRLVVWLLQSYVQPDKVTWTDLTRILQAEQTNFKLGQKIDFSFWKSEDGWPLTPQQISRRLALAIHHLCLRQLESREPLSSESANWHQTAWALLRDNRPTHIPARNLEIEILLAAASTARLSGDASQAERLTVLALHLLPPHLPDSLRQRCRVAAWTASEAGLTTPTIFKTVFEELPFPGEPAASEAGQAAAAQYLDTSDPANIYLIEEVQKDPDWDILRQSGAALQYPFAALMWIARKAQSLALKKQHPLLEAAARLALRHRRFTTLGRLLPYLTPSVVHVVTFTEAIRQAQRHAPFLRDQEIWQDWTRQLKLAWARLEPDAIQDPEQLFLIHETLLDREVTLLRSLPSELRTLSLRHLFQRKQPTGLVQTLASEPKQMKLLEHQRQVELWSIASEWRERTEMADTLWVSLAMRGEPNQGRYSVIIQGASGRRVLQDRFRLQNGNEIDTTSLWEKIVPLIQEIHHQPATLLLAQDIHYQHLPWKTGLLEHGLAIEVHLIPSFEWAFRVLREAPASAQAGTYLWAENTEAQVPVELPPQNSAILLPTTDHCDANTRWLGGTDPESTLRSLTLGTYPQLISSVPVLMGALREDLVRLSLAQNTRIYRMPMHPLSSEEKEKFTKAPLLTAQSFLWHGV